MKFGHNWSCLIVYQLFNNFLKKLSYIKLMRNKITDEGAIKLFDTIIKETK